MSINLMIIIATLPLLLISTNITQASDNTGLIEIIVNSAKSNKGEIEINLMSNEQQFESHEHPLAVCRESVVNLKSKCRFENIPFGEYAIFAYHDENMNNKLDENFLGYPKEKLAVSGVDLAQNQSPTFSQSKFIFNSQKAQIFINLQ